MTMRRALIAVFVAAACGSAFAQDGTTPLHWAVHKGDVAESLPHLPQSVYRLVHIDTDLYVPTLVCLDYFGSRVSPGGVIVVDDYGQKKCPGVPKAVAEYLARTDGWQTWDARTEQLVLVKR